MDYIWWLNIEYLLRECTERVLNYDNIDRTPPSKYGHEK